MPARAHPAILDAFRHAFRVGDWSEAGRLLETGWTTLVFDRSTAASVFQLVCEIPESLLRVYPKVGLHAEVVGRVPLGRIPVPVSSVASRAQGVLDAGTARDLVETVILAMIAQRVQGEPRGALELADAAAPLLAAGSLTRYSPVAPVAAYWHLQVAQAAVLAGEPGRARTEFIAAWTLRDDDVTGYVHPTASPFLALLAAIGDEEGERRRWETDVEAHRAAWEGLIEWETMERPLLVARLLAAGDAVDLEAGERLVGVLERQLGFDELWSLTLFAIVRHLVGAGELDRAARLIDATLALHPGAHAGTVHDPLVTLARADLAFARGRGNEMVALLRTLRQGPRLSLGAEYADAAGGVPVAAVRAVRAERLRRIAARQPLDLVRLTRKEERVLAAIAQEGTLQEIAAALFVSQNTLKTQLRALYRKLGARSREEAVRSARAHGLL